MAGKPESEEWTTVTEARSTVVMDTDGDQVTGTYEGPTVVHDPNKDEDYEYLTFRNAEVGPWQISASYMLRTAFDDIPVGTHCRITRTGSKVTSNGTMTLFKVERRG